MPREQSSNSQIAGPEPDMECPRLSIRQWIGLAPLLPTALFELVRARVIFSSLEAADIPRRNQLALAQCEVVEPEDGKPSDIQRKIGLVLPRFAKRMPFRSDCLVQAIAGQNWLARKKFSSEIVIGVHKPEETGFGSHAWLVSGGETITGGNIDQYTVMLGDGDNRAELN